MTGRERSEITDLFNNSSFISSLGSIYDLSSSKIVDLSKFSPIGIKSVSIFIILLVDSFYTSNAVISLGLRNHYLDILLTRLTSSKL